MIVNLDVTFVFAFILGMFCNGFLFCYFYANKYQMNRKSCPNITMIDYFFEKKREDFKIWAFGKDFKKLRGSEFVQAWNALHGDIYELESSGNVKQDLNKIFELFCEHMHSKD